MEEEIDLRPYIEALVHNWKWIIGATALAAVVALGISFLIPPTYEATALVAVTVPGQRVQFDPRFETVDETQPLKAYPELATSDELLQNLFSRINPPLEKIDSVHSLRQILKAESGSDPSLVRLTVSFGNATDAARIANDWAQLFVTRANEIYGELGGGQVAFFKSRLAETELELGAAEAALIAFQARDRTSIIDNELASLMQEQVDNLARLRGITFLVQDIEGFREQLARREVDAAVTYADQLTALLLQIKAYGILDSEASAPLQLQIDPGESLAGVQAAYLADLMETMGNRSIQIEDQLTELEPRMLSLQQQRQELEAEKSSLTRDRDVANETYTALARKVEEESITSLDTGSGVRLASKAAVPERSVSPRKLLNAVIAGTLIGLIAMVAVFTLEWWGEEGTNREGDVEESSSPAQSVVAEDSSQT